MFGRAFLKPPAEQAKEADPDRAPIRAPMGGGLRISLWQGSSTAALVKYQSVTGTMSHHDIKMSGERFLALYWAGVCTKVCQPKALDGIIRDNTSRVHSLTRSNAS